MASIINADTTNGIILTPDTSGEIALQSAGSTKVTIDSSGNVGIGTSSPATALDISTSGGGKFQVTDWGGSSQIGVDTATKALRINGTDSLRLYTGTAGSQAERVRIDSSGRVTTPYQPAFVATNNGSTHTTNVGQTFDFNVQKFDKGNNYDPSTYRFTAPVAGTYYFNFHIYISASASEKSIAYKVNGSYFAIQDTALSYQGAVNIGAFTIDGPIMLDLAANDYVEVAVRNVASADTSWYGGHSWFMGYLIG